MSVLLTGFHVHSTRIIHKCRVAQRSAATPSFNNRMAVHAMTSSSSCAIIPDTLGQRANVEGRHYEHFRQSTNICIMSVKLH
jgi:hypothetical protein